MTASRASSVQHRSAVQASRPTGTVLDPLAGHRPIPADAHAVDGIGTDPVADDLAIREAHMRWRHRDEAGE